MILNPVLIRHVQKVAWCLHHALVSERLQGPYGVFTRD